MDFFLRIKKGKVCILKIDWNKFILGDDVAKIILFMLGILFLTLGFFYIIVYTNLFTLGYSWGEYFKFMAGHIKNYSLLVGIILIAISLQIRWPERGLRR